MTFPSYARAFLLTCVALVVAGCSAIPDTESWFVPKHVAQNPPASQTQQNPAGYYAGPQAGYVRPPPAPAPAPIPPPTAAPALPPGVKIKVAILLPLSGRNAPLGQAMLNAAQLAVFDVADRHFELMPRDTASSETGSGVAARDAAASGAQLFIGPVFANDVNSVKPIAASSGLNMLALSTDTGLADQNVFVMGFAPGAQVERAIAYAHTHNKHRFAAFIPKGAYGDLVGGVFQQAVARGGDQIIDIETYDPARHDIAQGVAALVARSGQIDALFLPEGGEDLTLIAGQLAKAGFDNKRIKLIGTGMWDIANIGHTDFLIGGWYAAPDPGARNKFTNAYVSTYGQQPPRLVTLAYDATALAALLAKQGGHFDHTALTNPNGFAGIDGIFRLTDQGLVERGLAMLEVTSGGGHVIEASPANFSNAGF